MRKDLVLVGLIVTILALMVVPLPQGLLDVAITLNISLAVLLLMVAIYLKHPSDFSTFPSVILIGTAFRLALSVGTTRSILSEADGGQIIETFGDFVVSGSIAIGLVMFLIITVVQFMVVTKGAERVAEVGARFALDALPGKQMAIDADLRAGDIEQEEASRRRERLNRDSQFFGAMDGAMKFVKGDAIAGLIITLINLIGGIAVGLTIHGYTFGEAASIYSLLTIGDGLVAQIPALIMSLCAGIIVTRATNAENVDLGSDIFKELIADPRVPAIAALIIFGVGLIPGFPTIMFAASAAVLFVASFLLRRAFAADQKDAADKKAEASEAEDTTAGTKPEPNETEASDIIDQRMVCKIGTKVSETIDLNEVRREVAKMFDHLEATRGVAFTAARIVESKDIAEDEIEVELDDVPVQTAKVYSDRLMVDASPTAQELLSTEDQNVIEAEWVDRAILWVDKSKAPILEKLKLAPLDQGYQIAEFVFRIYEHNLGTLFSKAEFDKLMEQAKKVDSDAVDDLETKLTRPTLFQVLRYLVEDGVPIRPLRLVIESLTYWNQINDGVGPAMLAECLRGSLKRQMCHAIAGKDKLLGLAMVDPELEAKARSSLASQRQSAGGGSIDGLIFEQEISDHIVGQFRQLKHAQQGQKSQLVVVISPDLRRRMRNFLAANQIHLPVLSPHELSPDVKSIPVELISISELMLTDPMDDLTGDDDFEQFEDAGAY